MINRLPFLSLAGLLCVTSACIVVTDDGDDTSNDSSNTNTSSPATTNDTDMTSDASTSDAPATDGSSSSGATTTTMGADETTAGAAACGWGQTGDPDVPEGYICEGDGSADPSDTFPLDCPADVELVVDGECGGIMGPGCCDADGNVWFCSDATGDELLATISC